MTKLDHPSADDESDYKTQSRAILIALLFPTMAIILDGAMFNVALPTIRDNFDIPPDTVAWLTIAFTLPFMMLMPLFGRLGDQLGKRRLVLLGVSILCLGSFTVLTANNLAMLFIGRLILGVGSSGITPLSLAILSQRFSVEERGNALATWNAVAPATSIFAPSIAGFLIDNFGWRVIFLPTLLIGLFAIAIVRLKIPQSQEKPNWVILKTFDWTGVLLLAGTIIFLVFYLSSRPITGVEPLRDFRFLAVFILFLVGFIWWEKRHPAPLIDLNIFSVEGFLPASLGAGFRMAMMRGISFLLPLYLADIYDLPALWIGFVLSIHSVFQLIFIRIGGRLADRWPNRRLILLGLVIQIGVMAYFGLIPINLSLAWIGLGVVAHGVGTGLSLAALHRTALKNIAEDKTGLAAGVYSMTRFAGSMLAVAIAGVILQSGRTFGLSDLIGYQLGYGFLVAAGLVGIIATLQLRKDF
ncbi:MAG: MFS transporter [Anaerolineae bacterium]